MDVEYRLKNITPEESLMLINSTDITTEGKCWAIRRIQNPEILRNLLNYTEDPLILKTIIEETVFLDIEILMDFASNHENWKVRLTAVNALVQYNEFRQVWREILESDQYDDYINRTDLEDIALNDENMHNRIVASLLIDDESVLKGVALNDSEQFVKIAAINGIENQEVLVDIIKKTYRPRVLYFASSKITDESKIMDLIKNKDDTIVVEVVSQRLDEEKLMEMFDHVRVRAQRGIIQNIHNQQFLIDRVYKEDDGGICLFASRNIYNQKVLHDIVTDENLRKNIETFDRFISFPDDYFEYGEFLYLTVSLIKDDDLLADIVFNHPELNYEQTVAFNILNPSILADIFLKFPLNLKEIYSKVEITDTEKLFELALNHSIADTRIEATRRIFDKDKLERIIENDTNEEVMKCARHNLNLDESEFSLQTDSPLILAEVIKTMDDDSQSMELFNRYKNHIIRQAVCENIADEQLLKDIACNNFLEIASQAINNIASQSVLEEVALNASLEGVSVYAITKIDDDAILENIFENSSSYCCKINALSRITDAKYLEDVASHNPDDYLRSVARGK